MLQADWDPTFSEASYGFRPGRSAHQAVARAQEYIAAGYGWVVDLDLEKFFDRVDHDILMGLVAKRVADRRVLRLIRSFLDCGRAGGRAGRPDGRGNAARRSALALAVESDARRAGPGTDRRGHRFVRYADDCNIYVRSRRAGERVMASVTRFVASRLKLRVNAAKSAVDQPSRRKFLGFSFTTGKAPARRRIAPQALARFKERVRELTRRTKGVSLEQRIEAFAPTSRAGRGTSASARRRRCCADLTSGSGDGCAPSPGSSGAMDGTGSGSCSGGTCRDGSRRRPRPARTAPGGSLPARLSTSPCPTLRLPRSAYPPWPRRPLNPANRRVRTRMHGGVGGVEPQGSPLSRSEGRRPGGRGGR